MNITEGLHLNIKVDKKSKNKRSFERPTEKFLYPYLLKIYSIF